MPVEIDFDARRRAVLSLRLRRLSEVEIAAALGVHHTTVSRDLQWIREHWAQELGAQAELDAAQEIGEAIAIFADVEAEAFAEYHLLANVPGSAKSRARMDCLRTIMYARERRVALLRELGFLDRRIGRMDVNVIRADEVRQILQKEGLLGVTPTGPSASSGEGTPSPALMRWLHPNES